jgi:DNA-binding transcriptional LysR family regulator
MGRVPRMNFASLDLNLLRVFDALMREKSATRAGEQVGLSQPAVTAALNKLRRLLDDRLFVRQGAELTPTPRAEALSGPVRDALASLELALTGEARFDPATASRTYTLMGGDFFSMLLMPGLHRRIAAEAPGVRLRLVDSARGDVERLLHEDAIDVALERPLPMPEWVSSELLFPSPFAVIAAAGHPAIAAAGVKSGQPLPLDLFCALPHAMRSTDGALTGATDDALAQVGRVRRVVLALPQLQAVAKAVAESQLIAAVPEQFARAVAADLGLAVYAPPVPTAVPDIRMYWPRRHDKSPAHLWLRVRILEIVEGL